MSQLIQSLLKHQIRNLPARMSELSKPGTQLSLLTDEPTPTSYAITKIKTACEATLTYSWEKGSNRDSSIHRYSYSQSQENFPFALSLQPELEIRKSILQTMEEETRAFARIEPEQLDPDMKRIYTLLTTEDDHLRKEASAELVSQLLLPEENIALLSVEVLQARSRSALYSHLLENPGFFRCALENEEHNVMSRALVHTIVTAKMEEIAKEKDRISRIKEVITAQLLENQIEFSDFAAQTSSLQQQATGIVETAELKKLQFEISISNGQDTQIITLMPKKFTQAAIDEQKA